MRMSSNSLIAYIFLAMICGWCNIIYASGTSNELSKKEKKSNARAHTYTIGTGILECTLENTHV